MRFIKTLLLAVLLTAATAVPSKAWKHGDVALGVNFGLPSWNAGLHGRITNILITTNYFFDGGDFGFGVDWVLWNPEVAEHLFAYAGPGFFMTFTSDLTFGVEVPVGLMWAPAKFLEVYGQVVPNFRITPSTDFDVGGAVGFRFVL